MSEETSQTTETPAASSVEATTVGTEGETQSTTTYLNGKYDSVSALEAGYTELQSSYSKKTSEYAENIKQYSQTVAPENYELGEGVESTARIEALQAYGKEHNMSNDMLNGIIAMDSEAATAANETYLTEQRDLLGKDADTRLTNLQDWARANGGDESIFNSMITSAASVEFMESVMKMSQGTAQAPAPAKPAIDSDTIKSMRFEKDRYGDRKMSSDPAFRAKVEAAEAEYIANGGKL